MTKVQFGSGGSAHATQGQMPSVHDGADKYISGLLNPGHGAGHDSFSSGGSGGHGGGSTNPLVKIAAVVVAGVAAWKLKAGALVRGFISKVGGKLSQSAIGQKLLGLFTRAA